MMFGNKKLNAKYFDYHPGDNIINEENGYWTEKKQFKLHDTQK